MSLTIFNARSLFLKERRMKLADAISLTDPDILLITETWLSPHVSNSELFLPNYSIARGDRNPTNCHNTLHGGVLIAVKNSIPHSPIELPTANLKATCVAVDILANDDEKSTLCCLYQPPKSSPYILDYSEIDQLFHFLLERNPLQLLICGDLNLPNANWNTVSSIDQYEDQIMKCIEEHNFVQCVTQNTTASNTLDVILATDPESICEITVDEIFADAAAKSDHKPIRASILMKKDLLIQNKIVTPGIYCLPKYSYNKCDYNTLIDELSKKSFSPKCYTSADHMLTEWYSWLREILNTLLPIRTRHRQSLPPWISSETSNILKRMKTIQKRLASKPDDSNLIMKREHLAAMYNGAVEGDKKDYEEKIFKEKSGPQIFKYFRNLKKEKYNGILKLDNLSASSDSEKARLFNTYFTSVFKGNGIDRSELPLSYGNNSLEITKRSISDVLNALKVNKSRGPDGIPPAVLKRSSQGIVSSLYNMYRNFLRISQFPSYWKKAEVIPIFKKGSKLDVRNYRPISLLCLPSKVLEKIMFKALSNLYHQRQNTAQYAFSPRRSSVLRLLKTFGHIYLNWDNCSDMSLFLFDFSKAFDSVSHEILCKKIAALEIDKQFFLLLVNFLENRSQYVRINDKISESSPVTSGVPQGSIMGVIFFLIFIDDLTDEIFFFYSYLFADDLTSLAINANENISQLKEDLRRMQIWTETNQLYFNASKCTFINLKSEISSELQLSGATLKNQLTANDLGLTLSHDLKWSNHVEKKIINANRVFQMIRRNSSNLLTIKAKINLYKATIIPTLLYGSECIWPNKSDIRQIEAFNQKVTKWIYSNGDYKERLMTIKILPIPFFMELKELLLLSNIVNKKYDVSFEEFYSIKASTRFGPQFSLNKVNKENMRVNFWNRVPHRANILSKVVNIIPTNDVKKEILKIMWKRFSANYNEASLCSYSFICICDNCRSSKINLKL